MALPTTRCTCPPIRVLPLAAVTVVCVVVIAIVAIAVPLQSLAATIVEDGFVYSAGSLPGEGGGTGDWKDVWSGSQIVVVEAPGGFGYTDAMGNSLDVSGNLSIDDAKMDAKMAEDLDAFANLFVDTDGFDNQGANKWDPGYYVDSGTTDTGLAEQRLGLRELRAHPLRIPELFGSDDSRFDQQPRQSLLVVARLRHLLTSIASYRP